MPTRVDPFALARQFGATISADTGRETSAVALARQFGATVVTGSSPGDVEAVDWAQRNAPMPTLPSGVTFPGLDRPSRGELGEQVVTGDELPSVGAVPFRTPPPQTGPPPSRPLSGERVSVAMPETGAPPAASPSRFLTNPPRAFASGLVQTNMLFWGALEAAGDVLGLSSVSDYARRAGKDALRIASEVRGPQTGAGPTEQAVYSGFESMGTSLGALAAGAASGNPAVALGVFGGVTGGAAYREAREKGVPVPQALAYAASQGAVEVATEKIPVGKLLGDLSKRSGLLKTLAHQLPSELFGEQTATLLQDLNYWATLTPEKPLSAYVAERKSAAAQTLVATLVGTIGQTTALHVANKLATAGETTPPAEETPAVPPSDTTPPARPQVEVTTAPPPAPVPQAEAVPVEPPAPQPRPPMPVEQQREMFERWRGLASVAEQAEAERDAVEAAVLGEAAQTPAEAPPVAPEALPPVTPEVSPQGNVEAVAPTQAGQYPTYEAVWNAWRDRDWLTADLTGEWPERAVPERAKPAIVRIANEVGLDAAHGAAKRAYFLTNEALLEQNGLRPTPEVSNAPQEGFLAEGREPERQGIETRGLPPETGRRDSVEQGGQEQGQVEPAAWFAGRYKRFGGDELVTVSRNVPPDAGDTLRPYDHVWLGEHTQPAYGEKVIRVQVPARELIAGDEAGATPNTSFQVGREARWVPKGLDPSEARFAIQGGRRYGDVYPVEGIPPAPQEAVAPPPTPRRGPPPAQPDKTATIRELLYRIEGGDQDVRGTGRINYAKQDKALAQFKRTITEADVRAATGLSAPEVADALQYLGVTAEEAAAPPVEAPTGPYRYRLLYRPASFATLPRGLKWDYAETPASDPGLQRRRSELPVSSSPFGVIETERPLTPDELASFELEPVAAPAQPTSTARPEGPRRSLADAATRAQVLVEDYGVTPEQAEQIVTIYNEILLPQDWARAESVSGGVPGSAAANKEALFSVQSFRDPSWERRFAKAAQARGWDDKTINDAVAMIDGVAKIYEAYDSIFPQAGGVNERTGEPYSAIPKNADFGVTLDIDRICKRVRQYWATVEEIQRNLPNPRPLTPNEMLLLAIEMERDGDIPGCTYCYVEAGRRHRAGFVHKLSSMTVPELMAQYKVKEGKKAPAIIEKATKRDALLAQIGWTLADFQAFVIDEPRVIAALKKGGPKGELARLFLRYTDAANAAARSGEASYDHEILDWTEGDVTKANERAGLRGLSATDFAPTHILDMLQAALDSDAQGLGWHQYTKEPFAVMILGNAGVKQNMSIAMDKDADGNYVEDVVNGFPHDVALKLRARYPDAGTMLMAKTLDQILWALDSPDIDMMIPHHAAYWAGGVKTYGIFGLDDFSDVQHERWADPKRKGGYGEIHELYGEKLLLNYWMRRTGNNEQAAVQAYLDFCREHGIIPKFAKGTYRNGTTKQTEEFPDLANWNGTGKPHPGYAKLIKDYARTDTPLRPVKFAGINQEKVREYLQRFVEAGGWGYRETPNPKTVQRVIAQISTTPTDREQLAGARALLMQEQPPILHADTARSLGISEWPLRNADQTRAATASSNLLYTRAQGRARDDLSGPPPSVPRSQPPAAQARPAPPTNAYEYLRRAFGEEGADPNAPMYQSGGTENRASVEFLGPSMETSTALLRALTDPDVSSPVHELFHVVHAWLLNRDVPEAARPGITDEMIAAVEEFLGVEQGTPWGEIPTEAKERLVEAWQDYLQTQKAPSSLLKRAFEAIAKWFDQIRTVVSGTPGQFTLTPKIIEVFDQVATRRARVEAARQGPPPSRPATAQAVSPEVTRGPPAEVAPAPPTVKIAAKVKVTLDGVEQKAKARLQGRRGTHTADTVSTTLFQKNVKEYGGRHRPPSREYGAPASDLSSTGVYPEDVYSPSGPRYYSTGRTDDREAFAIVQRLRGKPDATVTVYRAIPKDVSDEDAFNEGDWVALTKGYAKDHAESLGSFEGRPYKVLSKTVTAKDITTAGDSIQEWGYWPQPTVLAQPPRTGPPSSRPQTETAAFKAWFRDSKVVDENGKPLVVYHGTASDFDTFVPGGVTPEMSGRAIWMTDNPGWIAAGHNMGPMSAPRSGANVMPLYVRIERPLVVTAENNKEVTAKYGSNGQRLSQEALSALQRDGFDGIILRPYGLREATEYVAFSANQVKSAIGNLGTFDPTNPNILFQEPPARPTLSEEDAEDLTVLGAAKIAKGTVEYRAWADAMVADTGDWVRPHLRSVYEAARPRVEALRDIDPEEYFNFKRVNLSEDEKARLRQAVVETVIQTNRDPKEKITFDEVREDAKRVHPDLVGYLTKFKESTADYRAVVLAARDRIAALTLEVYQLTRALNALPHFGAEEQVHALEAKIDALERDRRQLLDISMRMGSEDGRNLALRRADAEANRWMDQAFWYRRAAKAMGLPPGTQLPDTVRRQIRDIIARGLDLKAKQQEEAAKKRAEKAAAKTAVPPPRQVTVTPAMADAVARLKAALAKASAPLMQGKRTGPPPSRVLFQAGAIDPAVLAAAKDFVQAAKAAGEGPQAAWFAFAQTFGEGFEGLKAAFETASAEVYRAKVELPAKPHQPRQRKPRLTPAPAATPPPAKKVPPSPYRDLGQEEEEPIGYEEPAPPAPRVTPEERQDRQTLAAGATGQAVELAVRQIGQDDAEPTIYEEPPAPRRRLTSEERKDREAAQQGALGGETELREAWTLGQDEEDEATYADDVELPGETKEERQARLKIQREGRAEREAIAQGATGTTIEQDVEQELARYMMSLDKSGWLDTVTAIWKAGLLTGLPTHLVNLSSNQTFSMLEELSRIPRALVDMAMSLYTGRRTVQGASLRAERNATYEAATRGVKEAMEVMRFGETRSDLMKVDRSRELNSGIKWLDAYANFVFRSLSAEDRVFRSKGFRRSLEEQAWLQSRQTGQSAVEIIARPTEAMLAQAVADSEFATFNNRNVAAEMLNTAKARGRASGPAGQALAFAADIVIPFSNTPANVVERTLDYTPVGMAVRGGYAVGTAVLAKELTPAQQRTIADALGRGLTGSALIYLGWALAAAGLATGGGGDDDPGDRNVRTAAGRNPGAILLNSRWHSIDRLSPIGTLVALGASLQRQATKPLKNELLRLDKVTQAGLNLVLEHPMLTGLSGFMDWVQGRRDRFLPGIVAAFVPKMVERIAASFDPYVRDTRGDGFWSSLGRDVVGRVPGARQKLPPAPDVFGQPLAQSPFTLLDFTRSHAAKELSDPLLKALIETDVGVGWPTKKPNETRDQWRERAIEVGQAIEEQLRAVITPEFESLPIETRRELLEDAVARGRRIARRTGPPPSR